jgi:hypothetical protein
MLDVNKRINEKNENGIHFNRVEVSYKVMDHNYEELKNWV